MTGLLQDIRYALRQLGKNPGFAAVAIIVLALGIASATAIFSVVDVVLLHPLPYPQSDDIVSVSQTDRATGRWNYDASPANYLDWVARNHVFSVMAASRGTLANLSGGDRPERVRVAMTTPSFFRLFAVPPALGRSLLPEDAQPGHQYVAVLSTELWKGRYGADPAILGQNITLDGHNYLVVGVMPPNFSPDGSSELWLPSPWGVPVHPLAPNEDPQPMRDRNYLDVWGRLKPGVTLQQARSDMSAIAGQLEKEYPTANTQVGAGLMRMQDLVVGDIRPILLLLFAAVGFLLLICCANVANLLLARAAKRSREVSVRVALGASRARLIRQLLTESILLALIGGGLGVLFAAWIVPYLLTLAPPELGNLRHMGANTEVLAFSLALSVLTGILFGLAPAWQSSATNFNASLREGERGSSTGRGRLRSALVISEVGLSLVLLVGAGLLVKSFIRLMAVDPGFDPEHLLVFSVGLPSTSEPSRQDAFYQQVVERLESTPGVEYAGAVSRLPLSGGNSSRSFTIPGSSRQDYEADIRVSTPGYFRAMGIPLLQGRNFSLHDSQATAPVAIVNQAFVTRFFPGQELVGRYVADFGPLEQKLQIVGVIGNVRHTALEASPRPEIYLAFGQAHWPSAFLAVRTRTADPMSVATAAQDAVWSVDKTVPLFHLETMQQVLAKSASGRQFTMFLLTIFAGLAMLLAAIGLYGVMAYSVSQRTREIGIRIAMGARRYDVLRLVVGQGMLLAGAGVLLGIVASLAATRVMSGLLFAVSPTDPMTFALVAAVLASVALLANYLPARRAAKVDPAVALRVRVRKL